MRQSKETWPIYPVWGDGRPREEELRSGIDVWMVRDFQAEESRLTDRWRAMSPRRTWTGVRTRGISVEAGLATNGD